MVETKTFHAYFFREIPPCCVNTAHPIFRMLSREYSRMEQNSKRKILVILLPTAHTHTYCQMDG